MLSQYDLSTMQKRRNGIFEVNQQIVLAGLYQGGFFNHAAFYGGKRTKRALGKLSLPSSRTPPMFTTYHFVPRNQ